MAYREGPDGSMQSSTGEHIGSTQRPTAKYSALTNSLRVLTTGSMQCSMFCGGKGCKYDNPSKWSDDQMAIKGLFSHWVTKRILAMSRPSTEAVKKYDIISQFKQHGIKTVINLQTPGEHAHCGLGLEPDGFSYDQQEFMDNDVFFYNFGWEDYGVKSLTFILDMVKVMSFAVKEGKVAVHCHAGLGRTGVLIACYLIFAKRFDGDHAIHFVREKRPGSIQTKGQVECCQQFAQFLIPLRVVFASCDPCSSPFTLQQFINRQRHILHGLEARELKHTPKIVKLVCARLHELAGMQGVHTSCTPDKPETMDQLKNTVPGAFQDSRHPQSNGLAPPLRDKRSASMGQIDDTEDRYLSAGGQGSAVSSRQKSPLLDMRRLNLNPDGATVSSSEDDVMSQGRPSVMAGPMRGSQSESVIRPSMSGSLTRLRTSASLLNFAGIREQNDVEVVAEAMSFDLRAALKDGKDRGDEDEDEDEEDEEEEKGGRAGDGIAAAAKNLKHRVESLQHNTNQSQSAWKIIATEEDPFVLAALMWSWLEELKEPVLSVKAIDTLLEESDDVLKSLQSLQKCERFTLECVLKTLAGLRPLPCPTQQRLVRRFVHAATKRLADEEVTRPLTQFVEDYVAAFQACLPPLKAADSTLRSNVSQETTGPASKKDSGEGTKRKSKGKKKKDKSLSSKKSPRRSPLVEEGSDDSDEEQSRKLLSPARRGNVLPPIF